jgi:mannose-1-phosphate guanylyltransferase/phosphomannomutase
MGTKNTSLCKLKAVILVGGPGTRLQPLTFTVPKSLVPVLNRPVMEHMIAYLKQFGVEDVILTLSYLPDAIRSYFGDGRDFGVRLTYCLEKDPLGTAGAVKNATAYLDSTFIVLNGDIFTEMDLADMFSFHASQKARATIALTWVDNPSAFGVVETDKDYRVQRFMEKPPPGTAATNWINAGTYILEPEALDYIPAGRHYMFEKGLFPRLLDEGKPVFGYPYRGYWLDMGTLAQYFSLNMDFLLSKVSDPLTVDQRRDGIRCGPNVVIHPSAVVTAPVVIDGNCRVGKNVRLKGPVTIGRKCVIEDGARLENAILWDSVSIGSNARLDRCIISSHTVIGDNQNIADSVMTPSQTAPLPPPQ